MKWNILSKKTNDMDLKAIEKILLINRGITPKDEDAFLHPKLAELTYESVGIDEKELERATKRILIAREKKEQVIVYTDYDVDGISSGAIVWETLFAAGVKVLPHVPHRVNEGYGLSIKGIDHVKSETGATLIITVDHGVTAHEKITYAKTQGIDVIVLDHHTKSTAKLPCYAFIHTTQLCATGVAFFFANYFQMYGKKKKESKDGIFNAKILENLDLVAMATLADLVGLIGPNRVLVKRGLEVLNKTKRIGLNALIEECGLKKGEIGEFDIGHVLGPRINALGRLSHAIDALRLLCTKDPERAKELAGILSSTNRNRQVLTEDLVLHARAQVSQFILSSKDKKLSLIFLSHETYNPGIIGLIAGKLTEEHHVPSIVLSVGELHSKASARSIPGIDIVEVIRKAEDLLIDVGGHPMAAGFTVETKKIQLVHQRLLDIMEEEKIVPKEKELIIDMELPWSFINEALFEMIEIFKPFGKDNPEPLFVSKHLTIEKVRLVGKDGKHIKMYLQTKENGKVSRSIEAIGFGMGSLLSRISPGVRIDVVFTLSKNSWNGSSNLQLKLRDGIIPANLV